MRPLQYSIYKGMGGKHGAIQINLQDPHYHQLGTKNRDFTGAFALENGKLKDGWKPREGAVFLEATSTKDKNVYDWEEKIILALSSTDLGKIIFTLTWGEECKLIHDPDAQTQKAGLVNKSLSISSPKGIKQGVFIQVAETKGGNTKVHKIPLTGDEVIVMRLLLQQAVTRIQGW